MIKLESVPYPIIIVAHAVLAVFFVALPILIQPYFYLLVLYFFYRILSNADRNNEALLACVYLASFEVYLRMTNSLFFYEMIKYLVIFFMMLGIFFRGFSLKSIPYVVYLLLLIPSIVIASQNIPLGESLRKSVAFNLTGPVCLGIVALYCFQRVITMERLDQILKFAVGSLVILTVHLFIVAPSIQEVVTGTGSNFAASGGYGPNQVSTALGLGMFFCFSRFLIIRNFWVNIIDIVLLLAMTYRGWITFSRGGVLTAALMMLATTITVMVFNRSNFKISMIPKLVVMLVGLSLAWGFTSLATNGLIDKRYANEDAAGRAKADLTTGRSDLSTLELQAFLENPLLGIGAGQAKYYRAKESGVLAASHNETSRLLSEHGSIGVLILIILLMTPLIYRSSNRHNVYFYAFLVFWFATINHSAMRIAAPALFYGLALLKVKKSKVRLQINRRAQLQDLRLKKVLKLSS